MMVVYRKFSNGKEFMKIMDGVHALSVSSGAIGKNKHHRIQYTNNKMIIQDYQNSEYSMPSTEAEFNKVFKESANVLKNFFSVEQ